MAETTTEMPLCPVHKSLDDRGKLELVIYSHNCLACALHQREEMLKMLVPFMLRETEDAISVLERIITVNDRNYQAAEEAAYRRGVEAAQKGE